MPPDAVSSHATPFADPLSLLPDGPVGIVSAGLAALPHLDALLGRAVGRAEPGVVAVTGWGDRAPAARARQRAAALGVPYIGLEDPFLRSVGLGKEAAPPVGVAVDDRGLAFDARRPSRLEAMLAGTGALPEDMLDRAAGLRRLVVAHRLSKYNTGTDRPPAGPPIGVLLVDQVAGDRSIIGAGASAATFEAMAAAAVSAHGAAAVAVRRHPDVAQGHARGFLDAAVTRFGLRVVDDAVSVDGLLDHVDAVWTVSSQLGFDALLRGHRVATFGMPFYAGFGLTDDRATGPVADAARGRRGAGLTLDGLVAASLMLYPRYADPITRRPLAPEAAVERLVSWRRLAAAAGSGPVHLYGFPRWKRATAKGFLGGRALTFHRRFAVPAAPGEVQMWGVRDPDGFEAQCRAAGRAFTRIEDGFVRSVGLGSDLTRPGSLVFDPVGIYYDADRPSRLEELIENAAMDDALLARAARLRQRLVTERISKYNLAGAVPDLRAMAAGRRVVLVAGQVPGDAAVKRGGGAVADMPGLLAAVRAEAPDAFLVYKAHPDVVAGNRRGAVAPEASIANLLVTTGDITAFFDRVDALHVLSSLAGFEGLLRGVPVTVWGRPFYAGFGLTDDRATFPRRTRRASLDRLVAATLILYPRYVDPASGVPCEIEDFLDALAVARLSPPPPGLPVWRRQIGRFVRWVKGKAG